MSFSGKDFDQVVNGTEWKSRFHKEMAKILMSNNPLVRTREQLLHNVKVINSLNHGEAISISIDELENRGFYYSRF